MNIDPLSLIPNPTTFGIFSGPLAILDGDISQGVSQTLYGLTSINLMGRYFQADGEKLGGIIKNTLLMSISANTVSLLSNMGSRVKERNSLEILKDVFKDIFRGALGIAAVVAINTLDAKVILVAQQASVFLFTATYLFLYGYKNILKNNEKAPVALLLTALILLMTAIYVHDELSDKDHPIPCFPYNSPNQEQNIFLTKHQLELEYIYNITKAGVTKNPNFPEIIIKNSDQWHKLGEGISKVAYTHPDLPNSVIKIPNRMSPFPNSLETHYANLRKAEYLVNQHAIRHIKIPKIFLTNIPQGPVVIEEKLECLNYYHFPNSLKKHKALSNFNNFLKITDLRDIYPKTNYNACFLKGTENNPQIAVFDFDSTGSEQREKFRNFFKCGTFLFSLTKISKNLSKSNLVRLLITAGAISGGALTLYNCDYSNPDVSTADKIFAGMIGSAFGGELVQTLSTTISAIYYRVKIKFRSSHVNS